MATRQVNFSSESGELPPLPGEICEQYIRCGKPGCHCEQGQRHGPYYYRIWREGSHVKKVYVKRDELEAVQKACEAYRSFQKILRDVRTQRTALSRNIQREWRQSKRLLRENAQQTGQHSPEPQSPLSTP